MKHALRCLPLMLLTLAWAAFGQNGQPRQMFTLKEVFGIVHSTQIVDFDLAEPVDPAQSYLLGPDGAEVPYQLIDGGKKLAFSTDLPAHGEKNWKLMAGRAPAPAKNGMQVTETETYYEITNGLTGVRIPKAVTELANPPAPVQGVRLRDGVYLQRERATRRGSIHARHQAGA